MVGMNLFLRPKLGAKTELQGVDWKVGLRGHQHLIATLGHLPLKDLEPGRGTNGTRYKCHSFPPVLPLQYVNTSNWLTTVFPWRSCREHLQYNLTVSTERRLGAFWQPGDLIALQPPTDPIHFRGWSFLLSPEFPQHCLKALLTRGSWTTCSFAVLRVNKMHPHDAAAKARKKDGYWPWFY